MLKALLVVCGVLLVGTTALAVVSPWGSCEAQWYGARAGGRLISYFGSIQVGVWRLTFPVNSGLKLSVWWGEPTPDEWRWWIWFDCGADTEQVWLMVPIWVQLIALTASTWLLARPLLRTRHRRRRGLCASCGYDLHGNLSGVYGECGTGIARAG